jgi:uroporphyrinogen decarboxylase
MTSAPKQPRALAQVLAGQTPHRRPVWLMRQAGRYLPEYRKVRAETGSFLDLCYAPELASEVTLQPIRRYGFDAAIIFSDILVVPHALGQEVRFEEGEGPRLDPIRDVGGLARLDMARAPEKFAIVAEAITRTRKALPDNTSLIGFCGAPWTVATYMVGGRGSTDQADARLWAHRDPGGFQKLMDLLVEATITHLNGQVDAGADVLQLFDSWAGSLDEPGFRRWVMEPTARIVAGVKARHPSVPIIGFPKGGGMHAVEYIQNTGVDALGCDTAMPLALMQSLSRSTAVQGNLDPLLLRTGGPGMRERLQVLMAGLPANRHIVNLGHGIVPETPPDHVAELVDLVRKA